MDTDKDILLVGLTPPPYHGQSIATGYLFDHDWGDLKVAKLPIRYSKNVDEIGRPSLSKVFHMFSLVGKCWKMRFSTGARVLYYTPTSAATVPFVRDVVFLLLCRPLFRLAILHYHAGGLPDFLNANALKKFIGKMIYGRKAWAVALTEHVQVPEKDFGADRLIHIPNGIDVPDDVLEHQKDSKESTRFLFVGNLYEDKGIADAIRAISEASGQTLNELTLDVMGDFPDASYEKELRKLAEEAHCSVRFLGVCNGDKKWNSFKEADVFIFPSYYRSENQPLVVLEAMAAGMPVIATRWRGIPGQVVDGETGLLVDNQSFDALVSAVQTLGEDVSLRVKMGNAGRELYKKKYTVEAHISAVQSVFEEALDSDKS